MFVDIRGYFLTPFPSARTSNMGASFRRVLRGRKLPNLTRVYSASSFNATRVEFVSATTLRMQMAQLQPTTAMPRVKKAGKSERGATSRERDRRAGFLNDNSATRPCEKRELAPVISPLPSVDPGWMDERRDPFSRRDYASLSGGGPLSFGPTD